MGTESTHRNQSDHYLASDWSNTTLETTVTLCDEFSRKCNEFMLLGALRDETERL